MSVKPSKPKLSQGRTFTFSINTGWILRGIALVVAVAILVGLGYLIYYSYKHEQWCQSNNGIVIEGRSGAVCVRRDILVRGTR